MVYMIVIYVVAAFLYLQKECLGTSGFITMVKYSKDYLFFSHFHSFFSVSTCVHCYLVVTCWERADLLALVGDVYCILVMFPCGIVGQVWYLIVSFPDLCRRSYYVILLGKG